MAVSNTGQPGRDWRWLALIVVGGLALRLAAIVLFPHTPESDELAYHSMAVAMAHGRAVIDNMGNHAMYNVGYPAFILAPVYYLFGENLLVVRLMNMLCGGATIVLCYLVAAQAGAGRLGRLLAAAVWALYLPSAVYGVYLAKENLMIPLMMGLIWCVLRLVAAPALRLALGCGALFGLLALTGNAALALGGAALFALAVAPAPWPAKLKYAVAMGVAAAVFAVPWMARNMAVLGAPVLNTNGGFNLYLGNNPTATGWFVSIKDTPRGPGWEALRKEGEVQASETLRADAVQWIKTHPAEFASLALKKMVYFWLPPVHEGKGQVSAMERLVRLVWAIQFILMAAAAAAGVLLRPLHNRKVLILWLAVGGYTAVHMLFYVIFRYREPIMPIVGVMAALAIEAAVARWRQARETAGQPSSGQGQAAVPAERSSSPV